MDAEQLTELFAAHSASLILFARQWLDLAAAEDVVQDVYIRLMLQIRPPDNAKAWLFTAVRNQAISQTRSISRRRKREHEQRPDDDWFEPAVENEIDANLARQVMETLPQPQREIIVLRIWAGLSLKEIAGIVGSPVSTVFDQYRHGLESIRKQMGVPCHNKSQ